MATAVAASLPEEGPPADDLSGGERAAPSDDVSDAMDALADDAMDALADEAEAEAEETKQTAILHQQQQPLPKKPLGAYFLFANATRAAVAASLGKTSVAVVAKAIGAKWRALSSEQKQVYKDKEAQGKTEYAAALAKLGLTPQVLKQRQAAQRKKEKAAATAAAAQGVFTTPMSTSATLPFPLSRVKQLIKKDGSSRVVRADASRLITRATELFTMGLARYTHRRAVAARRGVLRLGDLVCAIRDEYHLGFLLQLFDSEVRAVDVEEREGMEQKNRVREERKAAREKKQRDKKEEAKAEAEAAASNEGGSPKKQRKRKRRGNNKNKKEKKEEEEEEEEEEEDASPAKKQRTSGDESEQAMSDA